MPLIHPSSAHKFHSFSSLPLGTVASESDLRLTFCVFAICSMLDDWTSIDVAKAIEFILQCRVCSLLLFYLLPLDIL
jgi:geranylgeranyl transferase type-1 subunit beta